MHTQMHAGVVSHQRRLKWRSSRRRLRVCRWRGSALFFTCVIILSFWHRSLMKVSREVVLILFHAEESRTTLFSLYLLWANPQKKENALLMILSEQFKTASLVVPTNCGLMFLLIATALLPVDLFNKSRRKKKPTMHVQLSLL